MTSPERLAAVRKALDAVEDVLRVAQISPGNWTVDYAIR